MSTPRKLLKRALGRDKALLDAIPLHKFEFKAHKHCWSAGYEDIAVHYGHMLDEQSVLREVWVHLSKSGRPGEIHYIGIHPTGGSPAYFKAKDIAEKARIRQEFQPVKGRVQDLHTFLRACIMLHGGKVTDEDLNFSESFLKSLRRACGRYKGDVQGHAEPSRTPGGHEPATGYASSPEVPLVLTSSLRKAPRARYSMTKSEQRGPHTPRFDALHHQSSPLPTFAASQDFRAQSQRDFTAYSNGNTNIDQTRIFGCPTAHAETLHPSAGGVESSGINVSNGPIPVAPRAMMRIWSKLNHGNARQFSHGDNCYVKVDKVEYDNHTMEVQPRTASQLTQPMMGVETSKANSPKQSPSTPSRSHISDSVAPGTLNELVALRDQIETVRKDVDRCKLSILEANATWTQRRESKCKEIDQDLCQKHKDEFTLLKDQYEQLKVELHARHKVEHAELKAQYTKMKEDHQLDISVLQELGNKKSLELEALEHRLAEQRQMLTKDPDKLLDAVLAQGMTNGKRKRETSSDAGRDSSDQDATMSG